jgi:BirA family biotin operon repressor/biotin-[acetyl-CoA-carboxylase] ligase
MSWDQKLYLRHLATRRFGREFVWLNEIDSTNGWLTENKNTFTMSGGVVAADHQTQGRGRFERSWSDLPGTSLLFSVYLRYPAGGDHDGLISLLPAIALAQVLGERFGDAHSVKVKWPNDVLLNRKKLSGILGQTSFQSSTTTSIVGMGVNVNLTAAEFPVELRDSATSIQRETGQTVPREILLADVLARWELLFDEFLEGKGDSICRQWEAFGPVPGDQIERVEAGQLIRGAFEGLGSKGQLLLRDDQNTLHEIFSGDIQN